MSAPSAARLGPAGMCVLALGFAFIYAPILLIVVYSFNASKLVTVWGGFSLRWYPALLENRQLLDSAFMSLKVALASGALATLLGGLAGLALARRGSRGRSALAALVYAPLVMPEAMIGLALLLLFVALGVERGFLTIVIAHATLGMCFVALVVAARMKTFDASLREAAMDLGAGPFTAFRTITLPLIAPALVAGFLLAFTISLDDVVLATFASGPGATTLPMRIYSQMRLGVTPEINAVSTLILCSVAALAGAALILARILRQGAR
jgi:putrescine transport system permease protein